MRKILAISLLVVVTLGLFGVVTYAVPGEGTIRRNANLTITPTPTTTNKTISVTTATKTPALLPRFVFGRNVVVSDDTNRDLFTAGRMVVITGKVDGDLFVAGGNVEVKGDVTGNIIGAGGSIKIDGNVGKNVIIAGGQIDLAYTSHVSGYALIASGNMIIDGKIDGSAKFLGGDLTMSSGTTIGGELQANVDRANGTDQAKITGTKNIAINEKSEKSEKSIRTVETAENSGRIVWKIVEFLGKLVVLFVLIRLLGKNLETITNPALTNPLVTTAWGLIKLVVVPVAVFLMLITVIGLPLGFLTVALYFVALYTAQFMTAFTLGRFINDRWMKKPNAYLVGLVGLSVLTLLSLIPVVGWSVKIISLLIGLGVIMQWEKTLFSGSVTK